MARLRKEQAERTLITADEVVMGLKNEAEYRDEGTSHSARVSAWGHLGKHVGLFGPKGTQDDPHVTEVHFVDG